MYSPKVYLLILLAIMGSYVTYFYISKLLFLFMLIMTPLSLLFMFFLRYNLMLLPFYIIAKIQGRKFKVASTFKDIKYALAINDKGRGLEELFAMESWKPILSLESVNDPVWTQLRNNFAIFKNELPPKEKISEFSQEEATELLSKNSTIDARQISISTLKIFLKWIFFEKIDSMDFLNETFLEKIYRASLEYRKEIAVKGKGCMKTKREAVDMIVNVLNKSQYKNLLEWDEPTAYSVIMQPFVISPMINMSDIAVNIKKYKEKLNTFTKFGDFVEYCIYVEHPFPMLERFDESTNTQIYINLGDLKNCKDFDGKLLNFGMGYRSCLGRLFAKEFLNSFFDPITKTSNFQPEKNHLYSGRDNDKINLAEGFYQIKTLFGVVLNEIIINFRKR